MARAETRTLLSVDRWAKILGINPVHFNGASGTTYWPDKGACDDIWYQFPWQHEEDFASREDLAMAIYDAEQDIKSVLGFSPAPVWEDEELHSMDINVPHYNNMDITSYTYHIGINTLWGYVISPGQRGTTAIETGAAVVYSDPDGDGWNELATITVATSVTNKQQIKVYTAGKSAAQEWEIRPLKNVVISGGTATITIDAWLLLDPDLWDAVPTTTNPSAINIEDSGNFVTTVDVYREYTDVTQESATFYWEPHPWTAHPIGWICPNCSGTGCAICELTAQNGCFSIRDGVLGFVTPYPGTYDATNAQWNATTFSKCQWPDQVKLWYQAGFIDQRYLKGLSLDPLSDPLAQAITWLSVARMDRDICACDGVNKVIHELQRDMTRASRDAFYVRFEKMSMFHNPFGTRVGEVRAWDKVQNLIVQKQADGGGF